MMAGNVTTPLARVVYRPRLDGQERAAVEALKAACDGHDGLDHPLHLEDPESPAVLHYSGQRLTGAATLQLGAPVEACALVDPAARRRGVGRCLLEAARAECRRRSAGLLLTVDERSASGHAFALAVGGRRSHAEHRLELRGAPADRAWTTPLDVRPAGLADAADFARIGAAAFGRADQLDWTAAVEEGMRGRRHGYYLGCVAAGPIATARTSLDDGPVYVTALAVLPEWQGRGYGRQLLTRVVRRLVAEGRGPVRIEVATDNPNALALYRSCGFVALQSYAYFLVDSR
jgi:ribosomal protein S18 acetylase RimI-like enzyme